MKVQDILTEAKRVPTDKGYYTPGYDEDAKRVVGHVDDWMKRIGASKEDIAAAVSKAKSLPSYAKLKEMGFVDKSVPGGIKNGTFTFLKPHRQSDDQKYLVYANGLIRSSSDDPWGGGPKPTRLTGPKPRLVAGNPVESLVKIFDGAFNELIAKVEKIQKKKVTEEKKLSFAAFKKSAKPGKAKDFPELMHGNDLAPDQEIIVYADSSFIEKGENGKYSLIIGNEEWANKNLAELEKVLYDEWYIDKVDLGEAVEHRAYKMTISRRDHASNSRDMNDASIDKLKPTFMSNTEKAAVKRLSVGDEADFTHMDGDTRVKVTVKRTK